MRRLLDLSCRAFPPEHRARQSDEVVDTALLAADGSTWRTVFEAISLVVAGLRARLHAESHRSARDGLTLLAGSLALVNLAVASAGLTAVLRGVAFSPVFPPNGRVPAGTPWRFAVYPVMDWWWIAFVIAATGVAVGLALGERRVAVGAALANLGVVGYDAIFLSDNSMNNLRYGHMDVFTALQRVLGFPAERQWLAVAGVLALATLAAPLRRVPLRRMAWAPAIVLLLVVLSRAVAGSFAFLVWPALALVVGGIVFGAVAPRLAVLAIGITLAAVASANTYVTTPWLPAPVGLPSPSHGFVAWGVTVGLLLGVLFPLAQLARRRLA